MRVNHCLASHGRCLPDLQFRRRLRYQHRAGQGWTTHFGEHVQFTDNLTKIMGKHTLRFGFDARREHYNALMYFCAVRRLWQLHLQREPHRLLFRRFSARHAEPVLLRGHRAHKWMRRSVHWGVYGQDTWQVNRHLTVNFGLRWELLPPFQETNGDIATFLTTGNNLTVVVPDKFYPFIANNPLLPADIHGISSGIQRMFASGLRRPRRSVFEHRDGEPGGASSRPSGWNWHDFDPRVSIA